LNQIQGRNHDATKSPGVPAIFGMNFQAVSVGQKLAKDNFDGSCAEDVDPRLNGHRAATRTDRARPATCWPMAWIRPTGAAEHDRWPQAPGLFDSTLIIVTAKHGQSPINPVQTNKPGHFGDLVAALPGASSDPAAQGDRQRRQLRHRRLRVGHGR